MRRTLSLLALTLLLAVSVPFVQRGDALDAADEGLGLDQGIAADGLLDAPKESGELVQLDNRSVVQRARTSFPACSICFQPDQLVR